MGAYMEETGVGEKGERRDERRIVGKGGGSLVKIDGERGGRGEE